MMSLALTLWLDLRGGTSVMPTLRNIDGIAISADGKDGTRSVDIPCIVLGRDAIWDHTSSARLGPVVCGSANTDRAVIYETIRRPERWLGLVAPDEQIHPLFTFAHAQAAHCRSISGCETRLLVTCRSAEAIDILREVIQADSTGAPVAALLPAEPSLWMYAADGEV